MAKEKRLIAYDPVTFESFKRHSTKHIDPYYDHYGEGFTDAFDTIEGWLETNTVDAVEVFHAYWEGDEPGEWHCSHCGEYAADGGYEQTKYCPNCGAKMDGERKDNG
jgi:rubrerythrin